MNVKKLSNRSKSPTPKPRQLSKKTISIGLVGLSVVVLIVYTVYSILVWREYQAIVAEQSDAWQAQLDTALRIDQEHEWDEVATQLMAYQDAVRQSDCDVPSLVSWQQAVVSSWRQAVERCQSDTAQATKLADELSHILGYIESEREIASILAPLSDLGDAINESEWDTAHQAWAKAREQLVELDIHESAAPVLDMSRERVTAVVDTWQAVLEAHEAQDRVEFIAARAELADAYDSLQAITQVAEDQLSQLLEAFARNNS